MGVYAAVAQRSFRRWSTYRAATVAGIFTNSVFGIIRASVLVAVVRAHPGAGGLSAKGFITFSILTQAMLSFVGVFGDGDDIGLRVKTGDIVTDFYRPSDFQMWWLSADVGRGLFQLVGRSVPIVLIGVLVYGLQAPVSFGACALFALSLVAALLTGFGLRFLTSMSSFWLLDTRGTKQILDTATMFGAGVIAPLTLFPNWLHFVRYLPFAGMIQTPADVFLGTVRGTEALARVGVQIFWVVALLALGRWVTSLAARRVVIQGG